ncbi:MAG: Polyprenol monophosphomannose synthase [Alphaproteobacteria bacterium MarineAlpha5_Bin8]|nr:MAG: Polyprenol monophosphomannose synthase [Alphaproteobacteria bacterium MarineAlpha5_Bin7]PPR46329.1 MAG: Polyprenol monophosphomannose synthase [Alphaproteobacteria bacterium MarineAlpha5_Bin8]PPR53179.1 MAG: Polyprenol monophosphomannose synthase [Alphaproteobacteria bacterium MarineAlpha5_Bin6]
MKLSILIPVYNELRYINLLTDKLFHSFKNEDVEYIFINDGSTDGSKEWLENFSKKNQNKNITFINFDKNQGKGMALREGLKASIGDYILFQDSDLELDPQDSYEMYKIIKNDSKIDCLFGTRYLSGKIKKNNNFINEIVGRVNSIIFNFLFHQSVSDVHCGTKIISKNVKNKINLSINDFGFEIDLATQIVKNNFDIFEYGISYFARTVDEGKKITWIDGFKSHYYLFKTRFIDNSISTQFSIFYSVSYMLYIGSFFGLGLGKLLMMILTLIVGLFIGLHRKIASSSIIYLMCFIGSLFSKGNGKIYTVLLGFIIGIYLSKKFGEIVKGNTKNRFINFFV